jgi:hypothetical protein
MYSLYPILKSKYKDMFDFTTRPEEVFRYKKNRVIFIFRFYGQPYSDAQAIDYFNRLRDHYDKIIYFEDSASPRRVIVNAIDYVDIYYKKAMPKDISQYKIECYAETAFGDYYHRNFNIDDAKPIISKPLTDEQIGKIKISWNIGIGPYPKTRIKRAVCNHLIKREYLLLLSLLLGHPKKYKAKKIRNNLICAMRFRYNRGDSEVLDFQRKFFVEAAQKKSEFFSFGKVSLNDYNKELRDSKMTFSPFGFGEICFRDFEAIINHSLLIKPNMDHISTWPDVYINNKTYIPVSWDGSDFFEKIEWWRQSDVKDIVEDAYEIYLSQFNQYTERLEQILNQVYSL